jgi:hypothetical protein
MFKGVINIIMNATQGLKRLFKSREKDEEILGTINRKLDILLGLVERLDYKKECVDSPLKKAVKEEFKDPYIPDIEVSNMEVKVKAKLISKNDKKVKTSVKKLKKLGSKKNGR